MLATFLRSEIGMMKWNMNEGQESHGSDTISLEGEEMGYRLWRSIISSRRGAASLCLKNEMRYEIWH